MTRSRPRAHLKRRSRGWRNATSVLDRSLSIASCSGGKSKDAASDAENAGERCRWPVHGMYKLQSSGRREEKRGRWASFRILPAPGSCTASAASWPITARDRRPSQGQVRRSCPAGARQGPVHEYCRHSSTAELDQSQVRGAQSAVAFPSFPPVSVPFTSFSAATQRKCLHVTTTSVDRRAFHLCSVGGNRCSCC